MLLVLKNTFLVKSTYTTSNKTDVVTHFNFYFFMLMFRDSDYLQKYLQRIADF
jgi:hypothetical protein